MKGDELVVMLMGQEISSKTEALHVLCRGSNRYEEERWEAECIFRKLSGGRVNLEKRGKNGGK